ncbi:Macrophage migration inhibitory factor [Grifola frondosa]|uniref:L-dopachrome isomerase n=1 Tax=Grifola frondosa TaxID=5627 RepID=A0A1C7MFC2_GRIFR|nr:Macrophage migration inhibitory factor [Grifola frondosa]
MPSLELKTNVAIADPKAFCLEFSKLAAKTLGKPEVYISVSYTHNEYLTFNGTFEPAFLLAINSLGNITPDLNEGYSKVFFEFFKSKLGISDDRGYILFTDPGNAYIGCVIYFPLPFSSRNFDF